MESGETTERAFLLPTTPSYQSGEAREIPVGLLGSFLTQRAWRERERERGAKVSKAIFFGRHRRWLSLSLSLTR